MAGPKSRKVKEASGDVEAFNRGLEQIFKERNIPMGKGAEWLILKRDPRRVASAYMLALDYCREVLEAGGGKEVLDAARKNGDRIVGQVEVFLGNKEARRRKGWAKLEKAREEYLKVRGEEGREAVPVKKIGKIPAPLFTRVREPGEKKGAEGLEKGTKISKVELGIKELEAEIAKIRKKMDDALERAESIAIEKWKALEKHVKDNTWWIFKGRESVMGSPEYKKLKAKWDAKEKAAQKACDEVTSCRNYEKLRELEEKAETLYLKGERRDREEMETELRGMERELGEIRRKLSAAYRRKEWAEGKLEEEFGGWRQYEKVQKSPEYGRINAEYYAQANKLEREKWRMEKKVANLQWRIEALRWTQEERKAKISRHLAEMIKDENFYETKAHKGVLDIIEGGKSAEIVGATRKDRKELDEYLTSYLSGKAREFCMHWGLSAKMWITRAASAEVVGVIGPDDAFVNKRLMNQLRKYEKDGLVRGHIAEAIGRIVEKHGNATVEGGGRLGDEATGVLIEVVREGAKAPLKQYDWSDSENTGGEMLAVSASVALGKTAKKSGKKREAINALAEAAVSSRSRMASVAAIVSISRIGGGYAKKKLREVRKGRELPDDARAEEIVNAWESIRRDWMGGMKERFLGASPDFSRIVQTGER